MSRELWNKNIISLRKSYAHIADYLEKQNAESECTESEQAESITCGVDCSYDRKVLYAVKDNQVYQLDTLYDPEKLLDLWLGTLKLTALNAKLLLFGLGNGMYVRTFLEHMSSDKNIIVFEPSIEILCTVFQEFDMSDILENDRVTLLFKNVMDREIQEYYYELMTFTDIETFDYSVYCNYQYLYAEQYTEYMKGIQNTCLGINSTQSVIGRYGNIYNQNTFANFSYFLNSKSIESLYRHMPKDVPAIIVAAGPSLDKNIMDLKAAKGRALLFAVDSAVRPMLNAGIVPDLCISVDGKKLSAHLAVEEARSIPMICCLQSHKEIMSMHTGLKFFENDLNQHVQKYLTSIHKLLPVTSSGGSVANEAFSIARMLGCTRIILVGQDLAFTDNRTHSAQSVRGSWNIDVSNLQHVKVEGIDGSMLQTSGEFILYKNWFEEEIVKNKDLLVIDATEGGAKIKGSKIQTLKQAVKEQCKKKVDMEAAFKQAEDYFSEQEKQEFKAYIARLPQELENGSKMIQEGIADYQKMQKLIDKNQYHNKQFIKLFKQVTKLTEQLDTMPAMEYVRNQIQTETTEILREIYKTTNEEKRELEEGCRLGEDYLQRMLRGTKETLELVQFTDEQ